MDRCGRRVLRYRLGADAGEQCHRPTVDGADHLRGGIDVSRQSVDLGEHAPAVLMAALDECLRRVVRLHPLARRVPHAGDDLGMEVAEGAEDHRRIDVAEHTADWTPEELATLEQAVSAVAQQFAKWRLPLPETILLVKLTGNVDGGAAYTRGSAIMLPEQTLRWPRQRFERLLAHELFHILSRHQPELRQKLYGVIGFQPCGEIELPAALRKRVEELTGGERTLAAINEGFRKWSGLSRVRPQKLT